MKLTTLTAGLTILLASGSAFAQNVINLSVEPTATTLPDGQTVKMWGYRCGAAVSGSAATCEAANPAAGANWSPVKITVPYAGAGTSVRIDLANNLSFPTTGATNNIPTSLVFVGQLGGGLGGTPTRTTSPAHPPQGTTWPAKGAPDPTACAPGGDPAGTATFCPPAQGARVQSFATQVEALNTTSLTWNNLRPGTYHIHSGTHPSIQVPMGLYGVLVVTTPATATDPAVAYPGVTYGADLSLVLGEIDPTQNAAVAQAVATDGFSATKVWSGQTGECGDPAVHTCYPPAVNYEPRYYLINGTSFDRSKPGNSLFPTNTANASTVLVRFVNAGLRMHVPSIVGAQTGTPAVPGVSLIAEDGNVLPGLPKVQTQVFLPAGKTQDVMLNAPAAGASALALFDRQLSLSTNNSRDGGMQGYVSVNGAALPAAVTVAAQARPDQYYLVAGNTLEVLEPARGVLANDTGIYGVNVDVAPAGGTLALNPNGTFIYTPGAGTTSDSFTYCGNGATSPSAACTTVTLSACGSGCLGAAPTANADNYSAVITTRVQVAPPGVLANDIDPSGHPLKAVLDGCVAASGYVCLNTSQVALNSDGSFVATPPAAGVNYMFSYHATNSQNTPSAPTNVYINVPTASGLAVTVKDAKNGGTITDYRWIIEEDRMFYIDPACQVNKRPMNDSRGQPCPPLPVPSLGVNFHTSHTPVVAQGCVGPTSCESGQLVWDPTVNDRVPAACDVGNGVCRTNAAQKTPATPAEVVLDPAKRYYISILPGDGVNPTIGGAGGAMQVDPACVSTPTAPCKMRQFDIAKDCGPFDLNDARWKAGDPGGLCGHAMGGAQIAAGQTAVSIALQQTPLPTAKVSVFVYQDDAPLNGEHDGGGGVNVLAPNEAGLGSFNLVLLDQAGGFGDSTGQPTYDMFNQPLTNSLADMIDPSTGFNACPISRKGDGLVGMIVTCPTFEAKLDGTLTTIKSPLAGHAVIANLYPGLYEVVATPAADRIARGEEWLQTSTLDGTKAIEAFIRPGEPNYFQEFGPGGYHVAIGFANPRIINARKQNGSTGICDPKIIQGSENVGGGGLACNTELNVHVTGTRMSRTPDQRTYSSGSYDVYSFTQCYVSLGAPDDKDFAFEKCDNTGSVKFSNVPQGNLRVTVFDQWNDLLVDGLSTPIVVGGSSQCTGGSHPVCNYEVPVMQWRTNLYTRTFVDVNGDGVSQPDEPGLPLVATNIRFRDGSYAGFNNTDLDGYAGFNEVFPFLNWLVVETDLTRHKTTGVHVVYDAGGRVDGTTGGGSSVIANGLANTIESSTAHLPASLRIPGSRYCASADCPAGDNAGGSTGRVDPGWANTQGWAGLLGQNSFIEWAVKPFMTGENGGIRGHVLYASTRPFDDPSLLLQLSWGPAIPNVKVNLYQVGRGEDGTRTLTLVDTTVSTSFDGWAQGFRRNPDGSIATDASGAAIANMSCPGQETTSPFYFTLQDSRQWLNPNTPMAERARFKCYDGWSMLNQVQPTPYDGAYKFPSVVAKSTATNQLPVGDPGKDWFLQLDAKNYKTNCTICQTNPDDNTPMLPPGKYVVEVIVPAGYELVKEEDKNILLGDVYVAPVTQQFAGFGNIYILPDQAAINARYNPVNRQNSTTNLGAAPRHEGDTGSVETFWPCVGATRIVPEFNSLFPGAQQSAPFAGASRPLCDRKEVVLEEQMTVLAKFYLFTSAHVSAKFTGTVTNDFASEFDPFSPQFGEKFGVPNLPVSMKDFNGNEMARIYTDQWGVFNGMNYSTYGVNPPNPTGYVPQMMIACMNDPGPIPGPNGTMIQDPNHNPAYANFCYEWSFMPGQTAYMDTPVIPTMAFAAGYNLPDCDYPDTTPAISSVVSSDAQGPWVSASGAGHTLTITALGDKPVLNHAYSGPMAANDPYDLKMITRRYSFGATAGTVALVGSDGVPRPLTSVNWQDNSITGTVPTIPLTASTCPLAQRTSPPSIGASARCAQLVITAANGRQSIDTVTVTIGGKAPTVVNGENGAGNALQLAIDQALPGDLILVQPGTYRENLLMWKPVRLQGVGAASVILNADAHPAGQKLEPWRRQVNCLFGLAMNGRPIGPNNPYDPSGQYSCPGDPQTPVTQPERSVYWASDREYREGIVGWDISLNGNLAQLLQEPTLMGAYEGAGITVLGKGVVCPPNDGTVATDCFGAQAPGINPQEGGFPIGTTRMLTNSAADCDPTVVASNVANFLCNPSRIDGITVTNSSQGGGAIFAHAWNHNLEISNNRIYANHGTLTGGITIGNGEFPDPVIAGDEIHWPFNNYVTPPGTLAGEQLGYGYNVNVNVHHNSVTSNASIGDALFSGTPSAAGGVTFCSGADNYKFKYNWVCGNLSTGDGAGVAHSGFSHNGTIANNWILFNQAQNPTIPAHGGGIAVLGPAPDSFIPGTPFECGAFTDVDCPPGLSEGTGKNLVIDANLIIGNSAESGSGGGIRLQKVNGTEVSTFPLLPGLWYEVMITNNIIANNVAGWDGGGVSIQDALKVKFINNTVISNDTTASSGALFNTLGATVASVPPPGCNPTIDPNMPQDPNCTNPVKTSEYQAAGLVTMANTPNLTASLPGVTLCPIGHSSGLGALQSVSNGDCTKISYPLLQNNVFWQNRAFRIDVGGFGSGNLSQQHVVTLVPTLNQPPAPAFDSATNTITGGTGACVNGANFWDIGVRGDTGPSNHGSGFTLTPMNSILTSFGDAYNNNNNQAPGTVGVVQQYCNGARMPPERCAGVTDPLQLALCRGFNAPAGRSETTGLYPAFDVLQMQPAATVDEGNNWINLAYGPLALANAASYTGKGVNLPPLGDYSITPSSPAIDSAGSTLAPDHDFFGNSRPSGRGVDIGAVELRFATISPAAVQFGNVPVRTSASRTVTFTNVFAGSLTGVTPTIVPADPYAAAAFAITANNCPATLPVGGTCNITVGFTPPLLGGYAATLQVAYSAGTHASMESVAVTGTGTGSLFSIVPNPVPFPNTLVNTVSAPSVVTVTNNQRSAMGFTSVSLSGLFPAQYVMTAAGTTCSTAAPLNPGASCTVSITFNPQAELGLGGIRPANLTLGTSSPTTTTNVPLNGTAILFLVDVTPKVVLGLNGGLTFANQVIGSTSATLTATLTNYQSTPVTFVSASLPAGPFAIVGGANRCVNGGIVPANGGTCTINVQFAPTSRNMLLGTNLPWLRVITLNLTGSGGTNPTVILSGTATVPTYSGTGVSCAVNAFTNATTCSDSFGAGTGIISRTLTVTNPGAGNVTMSSTAAIGGQSVAGAYSVTANTCTAGTTIAAGGNCTITMQLNSTAAAPTATLTVATTAGTQTFALRR